MMVATLGIALPEIRGTFLLSEVAGGSLFSVMMVVCAQKNRGDGPRDKQKGRKTPHKNGRT
ncbi:MAG: hypothetical protein ABWZ38_09240, partial [Candidatus Binatia bacterium]